MNRKKRFMGGGGTCFINEGCYAVTAIEESPSHGALRWLSPNKMTKGPRLAVFVVCGASPASCQGSM